MRSRINYAVKKTLPVMAGYMFLGIAFGVLLEEAGYSFVWALAMSLFIYAGSLQFAMVPLLASCASPLTMAFTAFFVNARHLFYGLSFIDSFKKLRSKPYMIFSLTDETYSVLCGCKDDEESKDKWFLIALFDHIYWVTGSVIGALLGKALPFDLTGIDFSMTALFIVILLEQILSNPSKNRKVAIISLCVSIIFLMLFGPDKFLLPAMIITVSIMAAYCSIKKEDVKND